MALLDVRDLSVDYLTDGGTALHAVEGVSFCLEEGRSLGIVGESGCGKTTVMMSPPASPAGGGPHRQRSGDL